MVVVLQTSPDDVYVQPNHSLSVSEMSYPGLQTSGLVVDLTRLSDPPDDIVCKQVRTQMSYFQRGIMLCTTLK